MEDHIRSSVRLLRLIRDETDAIGVAVSFGKDSLATVDLCCRLFPRVEAYYLYRVRGLEIVAEWAEALRARCGVVTRMYPHFDLSRCYRHSVLQPIYVGRKKVPAIKMADVERKFRQDAQVEWIAYGWRRSDSRSRALIMKANAGYDIKGKRVFPLRFWRRQNVYDYLAARGIPLPDGLGRKEQGGLDFHPAALRALSPEDRERWLADFPLSEIQLPEKILRRVEESKPATQGDEGQRARMRQHKTKGASEPGTRM